MDKDILDVNPPDKEENKSLLPNTSKLSGLASLMNKSGQKDGTSKLTVNIPKSIIPILKDYKDSVSSETLYDEITKSYKNKIGSAPLIFFMMDTPQT